ncbi:hypothetical protein Dsin_005773 [Dipteronia sinensis]|uniref:Uncharacterized protein n=1 Tax=Dipteronia sinensis TaxID=43782 RepID=A0AAE0AX53_9ROSI|nr:hypothetical protein Dsin_005773 [Dipteronia sinensis]
MTCALMMSMEALAMAGADYTECCIELQVTSKDSGFQQQPPPYLMAEQNSGSTEIEKKIRDHYELDEQYW